MRGNIGDNGFPLRHLLDRTLAEAWVSLDSIGSIDLIVCYKDPGAEWQGPSSTRALTGLLQRWLELQWDAKTLRDLDLCAIS